MRSAFAVYNNLKKTSEADVNGAKSNLNNTQLEQRVQQDLPALKQALRRTPRKSAKPKSKNVATNELNDGNQGNKTLNNEGKVERTEENVVKEEKKGKRNKRQGKKIVEKMSDKDMEESGKRAIKADNGGEKRRKIASSESTEPNDVEEEKEVVVEAMNEVVNYVKDNNEIDLEALDEEEMSDEMSESDITDDRSYPLLSFVDFETNEGAHALARLIHPVSLSQFFESYWEQQPLHLSSKKKSTNKKKSKGEYKRIADDLFSTSILEHLLRTESIHFTRNLDVTSYSKKKGRETHNPGMDRAYPAIVFDYFNQGCSLRLLNPQTFHKPIWQLCQSLQELFGSLVGANIYLTPKGSQGFAPHYDDVDVFIIQLEGAKKWKLHRNLVENQKLDRFSSKNFNSSEIGEIFFEQVLTKGDLLYLPRGTIHQAECLKDQHSLHITLSTYQKNCVGDLLEQALPKAISDLIENDVALRKGLPLNMNRHANPEAHEIMKDHIKTLLKDVIDKLDLNWGTDALAKRFMSEALPPCLSEEEKQRSVEGDGEKWDSSTNEVANRVAFDSTTRVKLLRSAGLRLVEEVVDDNTKEVGHKLYYSSENSREFMALGERELVVERQLVPLIETLLRQNDFVAIEDLPMEEQDDDIPLVNKKIVGVQTLWEKKLVVTQEPLQIDDEDE